MVKKNKNQILREAADDFAKKASRFLSVLEIAIVGSVAGDDPYPNDLDISLVADNLDELAQDKENLLDFEKLGCLTKMV